MTDKQQAFCDEYLAKGMNATQAYLSVYKNIKNKNSAAEMASRLLRNVKVRAYIDTAMAKLHDERTMDAKEVMERLTSIAREQTTDDTLTMEGDIVKVRSHTKERIKALELLGKAHGLFEKNVNLTVDVPVFGGEDELQD